MNIIKIIIIILISINIPMFIYNIHLKNEKKYLNNHFDKIYNYNNELNITTKKYLDNISYYKQIKQKTKFIYNQDFILNAIKRQVNLIDSNIIEIFEENILNKNIENINYIRINLTISTMDQNNFFILIKNISKIFLIKIENIKLEKCNNLFLGNIVFKIFLSNK